MNIKQFYFLLCIPFTLLSAERGKLSRASFGSMKRQGGLYLQLTEKVDKESSKKKKVLTVSTSRPFSVLSELKGLETSKEFNTADEIVVTNAQLGALEMPHSSNPFIGLSILSLDSCGITELPDRVFMGFAAIISLTVANNEIEALGPATFEGLPRLERLDLSRNKLCVEKFSLETFNSCPTLRRLFLDYNPWTEEVRNRHLVATKLLEILPKGKYLQVSAMITHAN